jgi:hypothetical protein
MRFDEKGIIVQVGELPFFHGWTYADLVRQVRAYLDSALVQKAVDQNP